MSGVRVLLVDDHAIFREGLSALLSVQPEIDVVGEAANGEAALGLVATCRPDVVVMDVRMPVLDGVAATKRLRATDPHCRIILLTTYDDDEYVFDGLRAGAVGYLLKNSETTKDKLVEAIHTAMRGEAILTPVVARKVVDHLSRLPDRAAMPEALRGDAPQPNPLSDREVQVVALIADGRSNREIADRLHLSEGTVKQAVSMVLGKLGARDRGHAAVIAKARGLI